MKVIERTEDGLWYESCDGTEHYLTSKEVEMMLELLEPLNKDN